MNLKKILTEDSILLSLKAETKQDVIREMIDFLVTQGKIDDRETALQAVLDRETKMSTGMQHGIAIPHGKTSAVDQLIVAIAFSHVGVAFDAIDKQPSRIFVMTLSPMNRSGPHIQILAQISKLLSQKKLRVNLLNAQNKENVLALLLTL